jgi:hypothetical protein
LRNKGFSHKKDLVLVVVCWIGTFFPRWRCQMVQLLVCQTTNLGGRGRSSIDPPLYLLLQSENLGNRPL